MKRTRRISIEIEHREITVITSRVAPVEPHALLCPGGSLSLAEAAASLGLLDDVLLRAIAEGSVHFHRLADGQLLICGRPCMVRQDR